MQEEKLVKQLGFWDILFFAIGGIVGAGIYAIIGQAAGLAGNMLWLSFTIAAAVALLTGLAYAEFVSRFPDAGGSFEYFKQTFGLKTALFLSVFMMFTGIVAAATISISFADYLSRIWQVPMWMCTTGIIGLMAFFNIIGSKYSSYYNIFSTFVTLVGLGLVIFVSVPSIGNHDLLQAPSMGINGIVAGAALIFFSYIGFEDTVKMAEETKDAKKNMPSAILISGVVVFILYVIIAICAVSVLGATSLARSSGPLAAVIEHKIGSLGGTILLVVALFATSKTILSNILGTSRLLYDIARDSNIQWLKSFTRVSGFGNAPNNAILSISVVAGIFALIGDLKTVASINNVFIYIVFAMVNVAMIRFRYLEKRNSKDSMSTQPHDGFKIPLSINNLPIPTFLALITICGLFGYNLINLFN